MAALVVSYVAASPTFGWTGRSLSLLDPTYASKYIPIIASVSGEQRGWLDRKEGVLLWGGGWKGKALPWVGVSFCLHCIPITASLCFFAVCLS